jgi:hypothetical protein
VSRQSAPIFWWEACDMAMPSFFSAQAIYENLLHNHLGEGITSTEKKRE